MAHPQKSASRHPLLVSALIFLAGLGGGYLTFRLTAASTNIPDTITREGGYQFINPLLSCDFSENQSYAGYSSLQSQLQSSINSMIAQGKAKRISVYFRNMDYGYWTGVNQDDTFIPGSLMKVPLMMAYLKESQTDTSILQKNIFLPQGPDANSTENIKSPAPLALGRTYSVQELLNALIEQSDNNAAAVLSTNVATSAIDDVYTEVDVNPGSGEDSSTATPKTYMRFFRFLYNSSFLGRTRSQDALKILAQTAFKNGIVAGVPSNAIVAHKFGERRVEILNTSSGNTSTATMQLHDCGIVYYPGSPYGICVMTEGNDFTQLEDVIAQLSKLTYSSVQSGLLKTND